MKNVTIKDVARVNRMSIDESNRLTKMIPDKPIVQMEDAEDPFNEGDTLEEGQKLEYGYDGSMIITGFDRKMNDLVYYVGTVSDHTLTLEDGEEISLRDLCGRNAKVRFALEW